MNDLMNHLVPDASAASPALRANLAPVPFGPAPLAEGEDASAYDELLLRISSAVRPADIFEEIWVRDIVDLTWEVLRLRRLKACLMTVGARRALELDLRPLVGFDQAKGLARGWAARVPDAARQVAEHFAANGIEMENVAAKGLGIELDSIERVERITMAAEARRNAALREIDRHRATLARRLREAVIEAEADAGADAGEAAGA
jgi:hypothetical protein